MEPIKLHLGAGIRNFGPEWVHIDQADFPHIKYKDVTNLSQFEDNSVDLIYASHLIAYFDRQEIIPILKEWNRVLKPGGTLRIATPDFDQMVDLYSTSTYSLESFLGPLYGKWSINEKTSYHKTTYNFDSLDHLLFANNFICIHKYDWRNTEHSLIDDHSQAYLPKGDKENGTLISLNVEARKPW